MQVWDTAAALNRTAEPSLQSLERQLAARPEPLRAVQRLQDLLDTLLDYTVAIPFWRNPVVSLEALAEQVDLYDWYRCAMLSLLLAPPAPGSRFILQGPLGSQHPVPELSWAGGTGLAVATVAAVSRGDMCLENPCECTNPRTASGSLWAPGCLPQLCQA